MLKMIFIALNVVDFILCALDKYKAIHNKWRIPEKVLLSLGFCGGCFGLMLSMIFFHHKVSKKNFYIPALISLILWLFILYRVAF